MKANQKKKAPAFGEFIMAVYDAWGKRRASGIIWLAVSAQLVEFRGQQRVVIFENFNSKPKI
jgi:hypothetical protein